MWVNIPAPWFASGYDISVLLDATSGYNLQYLVVITWCYHCSQLGKSNICNKWAILIVIIWLMMVHKFLYIYILNKNIYLSNNISCSWRGEAGEWESMRFVNPTMINRLCGTIFVGRTNWPGVHLKNLNVHITPMDLIYIYMYNHLKNHSSIYYRRKFRGQRQREEKD